MLMYIYIDVLRCGMSNSNLVITAGRVKRKNAKKGTGAAPADDDDDE